MATDSVTLTVTARTFDEGLHVTYALTNAGPHTIVAYDGAAGLGEGEYPDLTGQCYVSYTGQEVARILRIRPPAHPTKETTRTFMPAASEIPPGETRHVQFRLPLPLKERSEFSPDFSGARYEKHRCLWLELRIGHFLKTPDTVLKPYDRPNVWQVVKGASLAETRQVGTTTAAAFDLLVRTDPGFIRM